MQTKTIEQQIACVEREIKMRERVYPKWINTGRMNRFVAEHELETMKEVLATLTALKEAADPQKKLF